MGTNVTPRDHFSNCFFHLLKAASLAPNLTREFLTFRQRYRRSGLYLGWDNKSYQDAISAACKVYPGISEAKAKGALERAVVELVDEHSLSDEASLDSARVDSIFHILESHAVLDKIEKTLGALEAGVAKWTAFVFIAGIELQVDEVHLGVATLYPVSAGPFSSLQHGTAEALFPDIWHLDLIEQQNSCYLAIEVEGDECFASQKSLSLARDAVNLLNFGLVTCQHKAASYQRIEIAGLLGTEDISSVYLCCPPAVEDSDNRSYACDYRVNQVLPHVITEQTVRQWTSSGLEVVVRTLKNEDRVPGHAESRIYYAITWYGRAMSASTEEEQFVALTTALESLLVAADGTKNIAQRLADSVSALVGSGYESRKGIQDRMKKLYELRGKVVHGGNPVPMEELRELNEIVRRTIWAFIRREACET
ncbi:MAG: hypothetical protein ACYC5M_18865 [Anaerolineae bacterium]